MFSDQSNLFELEENELEFYEICSKLKSDGFASPWSMFFNPSAVNEFNIEVSEFTINDDNALEIEHGTSAQLNVQAAACTSGNISKKTHTTISDEIIDEKKVSRLKESLITVQENSTIDHIKDVDIFLMISSTQIPVVFKMLDLSVLNESAITLLLNAFLLWKDKISMATATALVQCMVLPIISEIRKNNSRSLLTIILKFSETYPKPVIDEVVVPYLKDKTTDDLQLEILFQIAKVSLPNEYVACCIKNVLEHAKPVENSFALLQCLIERKVHHEKGLYDLLLQKLLSWTPDCNRNVKFTKLLTSILSAYGSELTAQQIVLCDEVVKNNKTIIKKAAENLLKKLKQENF